MTGLAGAIARLGLAALAATLSCAAAAETFPSRPITIVIPYPPGASTDQVARLVQPKLQDSLGQTVVLEHRGGGSGNIGNAAVAKAAPDGHTILLSTNAIMTINPHIFRKLPFDPLRDFAPLTTAVRAVLAIAVHPSVPVRSVADLIGHAKAHPRQLHYGTAGTGTPHHMAGLALNQAAGIELVHVAYKGGSPAANDLLGGHIPMGIFTLSTVLQHGRSGRLNVIAIGEPRRFEGAPDIPAIAETLPGFEATSWLAFFAPGGTPAPIVERLNAEVAKALALPDVRERLAGFGAVPLRNSPAEFQAFIRSEIGKWAEVVKTSGAHVD
jgi:tripartite-type tricarboxylate transporter receptor subunit TctC